MMWKKRTLVLGLSLTVVTLTIIMLTALVLHKTRRKSSQTSGFLTQTRSRKQAANTMAGIERRQLRGKIQRQQLVGLARVEDNYGDGYDYRN